MASKTPETGTGGAFIHDARMLPPSTPPAPQRMRDGVTAHSFTVAWPHVEGAKNYFVYVSKYFGPDYHLFMKVATVMAPAALIGAAGATGSSVAAEAATAPAGAAAANHGTLSYIVAFTSADDKTPLEPSTTYEVAVKAVNAAGESGRSKPSEPITTLSLEAESVRLKVRNAVNALRGRPARAKLAPLVIPGALTSESEAKAKAEAEAEAEPVPATVVDADVVKAQLRKALARAADAEAMAELATTRAHEMADQVVLAHEAAERARQLAKQALAMATETGNGEPTDLQSEHTRLLAAHADLRRQNAALLTKTEELHSHVTLAVGRAVRAEAALVAGNTRLAMAQERHRRTAAELEALKLAAERGSRAATRSPPPIPAAAGDAASATV